MCEPGEWPREAEIQSDRLPGRVLWPRTHSHYLLVWWKEWASCIPVLHLEAWLQLPPANNRLAWRSQKQFYFENRHRQWHVLLNISPWRKVRRIRSHRSLTCQKLKLCLEPKASREDSGMDMLTPCTVAEGWGGQKAALLLGRISQWYSTQHSQPGSHEKTDPPSWMGKGSIIT